MPRPPKRDELAERMNQPTYERELRSAASLLRHRAKGIGGVRTLAVQISPEFANWIADRMDNHADDVELNRG